MEYRTFGRTGWEVGVIGVGAWAMGGAWWGGQEDGDSLEALHAAVDRGANFIDTAQAYGDGRSEQVVGRFLRERKERIYVATKVPPRNTFWGPPPDADIREFFPREYVVERCEQSLRDLGQEALDIYQLHTWAKSWSDQTEWYEAMLELKRAGKIRAIGVSVTEFAPEDILPAIEKGMIDSIQVIYNIFEPFPQDRLFPACREHGVGIIVRVPFEEGVLAGRFTKATTFPEGDFRREYFRGHNLAAAVDRADAIRAHKDRRHPEMPPAEYALRFCISNPDVSTVIPGMRNRAQAEENLRPGDGRRLDERELEELRRFAWHRDFWREEVDLDGNVVKPFRHET